MDFILSILAGGDVFYIECLGRSLCGHKNQKSCFDHINFQMQLGTQEELCRVDLGAQEKVKSIGNSLRCHET